MLGDRPNLRWWMIGRQWLEDYAADSGICEAHKITEILRKKTEEAEING